MSENSIKNIMDVTLDKLRGMVNADTVIGSPITSGELTLIPISKVSFGVVSGGSDFATKNQNGMFGGGGGAGVTVTPVAFLAISGTNVRSLPITNEVTTIEKAIELAPDVIDKARELFAKKE